MLYIASDTHRCHHTPGFDDGKFALSVESPDRADLIDEALRADGHVRSEPEPVDPGLLAKVHTPDYLDFLSTAWDRWSALDNAGPAAMGFAWPSRGLPAVRPDDLVGQFGFHSFAADCSIVEGTWAAALASASIAVTAADRMSESGATTYGLCRPPGHHATADQFGGYCYLNNAALAAERLLERGANRVAVLDVDYHHGNGTQAIFYGRSDVYFASIHADPVVEFPWFAGHANETGEGEGVGYTANLPLPHGTSFDDWSAALDAALSSLVATSPDALVVSLGVDTYEHDPISQFRLGTASFPLMGEQIRATGMPTIIVQEGGYAIGAIGTNVAGFLSVFDR